MWKNLWKVYIYVILILHLAAGSKIKDRSALPVDVVERLRLLLQNAEIHSQSPVLSITFSDDAKISAKLAETMMAEAIAQGQV